MHLPHDLKARVQLVLLKYDQYSKLFVLLGDSSIHLEQPRRLSLVQGLAPYHIRHLQTQSFRRTWHLQDHESVRYRQIP